MEMKSMTYALLMSAALLAAAMEVEGTVSNCGTVSANVSPCISYATNKGPLSSGCCNGVKSLYGAASSPKDRQTVCKCLKSVATSVRGLNLAKVAGLPSKCGVTISYKITPSTDCSRVN